MDVQEAKKIIDSQKVIIFDIRDDDSFRESHIPQAISLNDSNVDEIVKNTDKSASILCYCYHGISSQSAVAFLREQGFQNVYSLDGGFEAWRTSYPDQSENN